jgi:hypothetical protein
MQVADGIFVFAAFYKWRGVLGRATDIACFAMWLN